MPFRMYNRYQNKNFLFIIIFFLIFSLFSFFSLGCTPEPEETDLLLPVYFSSMPAGLAQTSFYTNKIEIHVKGPSRLIEKLGGKNLHYLVDLYTELASDPAGSTDLIKPGTYSIPVIKNRFSISGKIEITSIIPSFITVTLEKVKTVNLAVTIPYRGKPASGYIALPAEAEPDTVLITGAESLVKSLQNIRTKPVDITNARESFKKEVPLDLDESLDIASSSQAIKVSVAIKKEIITKTFENIKIKAINSSKNTDITPCEMEIRVKGHSNILKKSSIRDQFNIYIDLKGLKSGVYVRRAVINLPVGLILEETKPEIFTVKIE
ncbi:MAG: CdaR family protein [Thermodesulfobacteriota bacterium]|nr:CdaR family protein [Thermodesulfobacteriota bacterium]